MPGAGAAPGANTARSDERIDASTPTGLALAARRACDRRSSPPVGAGQAVAVRYLTALAFAFAQLTNRSARRPIVLVCQSETYTVVASAGEAGALSICSEASLRGVDRHAAIVGVEDQLRLERDDVRAGAPGS